MLVKILKKFFTLFENYVNLVIFQLKKTHFIVAVNYSIFIKMTQKNTKIEKFKKFKFY